MSLAYAQSLGFESDIELYKLVASVPIDTPEQLARYVKWRNEDGTKEGILKLLGENPE